MMTELYKAVVTCIGKKHNVKKNTVAVLVVGREVGQEVNVNISVCLCLISRMQDTVTT
jgi:hypothetical protein